MSRRTTTIIGGVDTHSATHHAAVIDSHGRLLDDSEFPASPTGYAAMLTWMRSKGNLSQVGVEGTGAYGAGLARHLHEQKVEVLEVPRPDRRLRRQRGKSDPIDAEAAARTVLAGKASGAPKLADGPIEAIRMLRVARLGAVKAKTAAINTLRATLITAPDALRTHLQGLSPAQLVAACARLRPDLAHLDDPVQATKAALRSVAIRAQHLELETRALRKQLDQLTSRLHPPPPPCSGSDPTPCQRCWSPSGTIPTGYAVKPRSPACAASRRSPPHPAKPTATAYTAAATDPPTAPCTSPPSCGCAMTHAAAPTPIAAPAKACRCPKSSAARSATSPAKSSHALRTDYAKLST